MKTGFIILLCAFVSIECRSTRQRVQIDKHANVDFINMEVGGGVAPKQPKPAAPVVTSVTKPVPTPVPVVPNAKPMQPSSVPQVKPNPVQPAPTAVKPAPVQPAPAAKPATAPGPGSVKQLVNFYDSQGKHSVIRPYSYSDAVKKGKTA